MWFERDISRKILADRSAIQVIRGPRQCGKSSLVLKLDPEFREVSLDDPALRDLAEEDPELFLKQFGAEKLFIDEAQYAPRLFPSLKRRADLHKRHAESKAATIIRLTGSNQILMDRNVKESLAGRASFFDLNTLSVSEILASTKKHIQEILFFGGWPELHARAFESPKKYLDDYINSYVEKDIVLAAGIQKRREFRRFLSLIAGRVGHTLDMTAIGNEAGVDSKTIKEWISILETMQLITLVPPYATNKTSRLIKSPKLYFIDTGLACRLQGWTDAEPMFASPAQGHLFENLVFSEIYKCNLYNQLGIQIYHWRSKDGEEVDFLLEMRPNHFLFVEAKVSSRFVASPDKFSQVKKVFGNKVPEFILCHQEGEAVVGQKVPVAFLQETLLKRI